jgi:hypothetical protein
MSPKQKKLAAKAPPPNKIDEKDFDVLRAEKAKGRGMGLQDEKIKPGKVMKAKYGKMMKYKRGSGLDLPVINSVKPTVHKNKIAQDLSRMKIQFTKQRNRAGANPSSHFDKKNANVVKHTRVSGPFSSMEEMRKAKGFKPGESASEFNKRRKELGAAGKALSATRIGKIALGVGTAGVAAQQYLKSKMNKKDEPKKKMGGGMMKKYSKGGGLDMGGPKAKIMQYIRDKKDDGQRLTMRDKEFIKSVMPKKMGGGMMQKPMGYNTGGGFDSGNPGKLRDIVTKYANKFKSKDRLTERDIKAANEILTGGRGKALRSTQEMISRLKKFDPAKKMGGGMMQKPMGYKSGTMVKARGCKLGRTRPTKIT